MKKLLLLGGDATLLPVIEVAHKRGYYVITCDYLPDNIAHKYSDEYINHSTTDKEDILVWAKEAKIDGVLTFTDSGVVTAAYISSNMGLRTLGAYEAIVTLQNKDKFRAFLRENGLNVPSFSYYASWEEVNVDLNKFSYPVMIKPVDAAGSKGVTKILKAEDMQTAFEYAVRFSSRQNVIIEDFISPCGPQIHGDCFIQDGKVIFHYFGDHHFDATINNLVPISTSWPSIHSESDINKVVEQVQLLVTKVGFNYGCMNVECRINENDGKAYLIDVGARSGGNYTPYVIGYASGFNFVEAMLDYMMEGKQTEQTPIKEGYFAYLVIHTKEEGTLKNIKVSEKLNSIILEHHNYVSLGNHVRSFRGANAAVGIIIVKFGSNEQMQYITNHLDEYIEVEVN